MPWQQSSVIARVETQAPDAAHRHEMDTTQAKLLSDLRFAEQRSGSRDHD